jgi:acetoin utilization protein AcuB
MFVSKSMTRNVITVTPEDSILSCQEKMAQHKIRHLPVVDGHNKLVSMISDRDIRSALPDTVLKILDCSEKDEKAIRRLKVADVMKPNPICITSHDTIQDALLIIWREKIGAVPVVDEENTLRGILSTRDLLRAFISVLGIGEPGALLGILVENKQGQLKKIVDIITEEKISTGSILVARHWEDDKRAIFPYLMSQNIIRVKERLRESGFELINPLDWYIDQI